MSSSAAHSALPRVLMVCLGNICRSPTAEAVFRHRAAQAGLALTVDSAGTYGGHAGAPPDARTQAVGARRGYDFSGIYSRQVTAQDFTDFDLILAADRSNLANLKALCPLEHQHKLALLLSPLDNHSHSEVPDPYYGGEAGFEQVMDMIELACDEWLRRFRE